MVMHYHEPECHVKRLLCCSAKAYTIKIWLSAISSELLTLLQLNFGLMTHHRKLSCLVKRLLHCYVLKVTAKVKNVIEFSSRPYLLNCWTFCNQTWYDDVSSWAKLSCENIGTSSSSSRSQWGLMTEYVCFSHIYWTSLLFLQPDVIGWYTIIFWIAWCKNWRVVFKVKVTVRVQIFIEFLSILYFLYHWSLGNQTRWVDVLLLMNKPSMTK